MRFCAGFTDAGWFVYWFRTGLYGYVFGWRFLVMQILQRVRLFEVNLMQVLLLVCENSRLWFGPQAQQFVFFFFCFGESSAPLSLTVFLFLYIFSSYLSCPKPKA